MTINNLRIFVEVFDSLNITQTAEKLYITQPSVSRAIKTLEDEYGVSFFERIGKHLSPTEEGKKFYQTASQILFLLNDLTVDFSSEQNEKTIRLGAAIMIGNFLVPEICKQFKTQNSNVTISVTIASANVLTEMLFKNELDIALVEDEIFDSHFNYIPFYDDYMIPVVPRDSNLAHKSNIKLSTLVTYPFLMRERNSATRIYVDKLFASEGLIVSPIWESSSTQAILLGVENNIGISILSKNFVQEYLDKNSVASFELTKPLPTRKCFIIYHKDKYISPICKTLIDLIITLYK